MCLTFSPFLSWGGCGSVADSFLDFGERETFLLGEDSSDLEMSFLGGRVEEGPEKGVCECVVARNHHFVEALP